MNDIDPKQRDVLARTANAKVFGRVLLNRIDPKQRDVLARTANAKVFGRVLLNRGTDGTWSAGYKFRVQRKLMKLAFVIGRFARLGAAILAGLSEMLGKIEAMRQGAHGTKLDQLSDLASSVRKLRAKYENVYWTNNNDV